MKNLKLTSIQMLRGLAAVWVVLAHATGLANDTGNHNDILKFIAGYGWAGVDIFFVLSGFVIYYAVHGKKITAGQFFARRLERIVPPYLLLTTLLFILLLALPQIFKTLQASFDHYLRSILYLSFTDYDYPVLYIGWTLEYEMFFYLIAAIALMFGMFAFNLVPIVICLLVLLGVILKHGGFAPAPIEFLTSPVMLEFCFGFFAASTFLTKKITKYVAVALAGTTLLVLYTQPDHRIIQAGLPSFVLLSVCLVLTRHLIFPIRLGSALSTVGDASYSIYLIQVFSLPLVNKLHKFVPGIGHSSGFALVATAFTVMCGLAFFRMIEQPMLNLIRTRRLARAMQLA